MGLFCKYFRHGSILHVKHMHAQSKPPMELASLLFVMDSPSPFAISPCMGNRQSNWRVPSRRAQRLGLGCSWGWQALYGEGARLSARREAPFALATCRRNSPLPLASCLLKKNCPYKARPQGAAPLLLCIPFFSFDPSSAFLSSLLIPLGSAFLSSLPTTSFVFLVSIFLTGNLNFFFCVIYMLS